MLTWSQDGGYPPPSNSETVTQSLFVVEWDNRATIAEYYATGRWKVRASSIVSDSLVTALRDTFRQYNFSALDSAYTGLVADVGSERITYCADPTTPNICTSVLVGEGAEFPPTFQSIRSTLQRIREHLLAN